MEKECTVVVIGGGATGTGILRDLAMRGVRATLFEQGGLCHGTSSRFHGLLHSGGRYVVSDGEAAAECVRENAILRKIGRQCVDPTGGFFVLTEEDDPDYVDKWVAGCAAAGLDAKEMDPAEALRLEPSLNPRLKRVFHVPDAAVDGFRLVLHNAMSAQRHGARFHTYHKVLAVTSSNGRVTGVDVLNTKSGHRFHVECEYVVNASGPWAGVVAGLGGMHVPVTPDRGTLVVFNHRCTNHVVNRLHKSSDGDIFVPNGSVTILGTTSKTVEDPADTSCTSEEALRLLDLGRPLFPGIDGFRILRVFAGTRPLYTPGHSAGRAASRGFHITDHAEEGLDGFITIFGGKLTTYRLMAEKLCDHLCARMGVTGSCRTAEEPLVAGPSAPLQREAARLFSGASLDMVEERLGDELGACVKGSARFRGSNPLICECEMVSLAELAHVARQPSVHSLHDVRLRTRLGMGTCQGTFCALRAVSVLAEQNIHMAGDPVSDVRDFATERWKGTRPVFWGQLAREMEFGRMLHMATLGSDTYGRKKDFMGGGILSLPHEEPVSELVAPVHHLATLFEREGFAFGVEEKTGEAKDAVSRPPVARTRSTSDLIVVGAGLSGLFAAVTAARTGARVTLLTTGVGSLSIAQGTLDVLGRTLHGRVQGSPLDDIDALNPRHPYRLLGRRTVLDALDAFAKLCAESDYPLEGGRSGSPLENSLLPTAIGTLKPAFMYAASQDPRPLFAARRIVVCGVEGLRDCLPHLAVATLGAHPELSGRSISSAWLPFPREKGYRAGTALDVARALETAECHSFFKALSRVAANADCVLVPPVAGTKPTLSLWRKLCAAADCPVVEMAGLPPGVTGLRLARLLQRWLARLDVTVVENATVTGCVARGKRVEGVIAKGVGGTRRYDADRFVVATGGVVSGGLRLEPGVAVDAVLGLRLPLPTETATMAAETPFERQPYADLGMPVTGTLEPTFDVTGSPHTAEAAFVNVRYAGRALGFHDPAFERSGNGVALVTAWAAVHGVKRDPASDAGKARENTAAPDGRDR